MSARLNTNGDLMGVVDLLASGLRAEYFANTNLEGLPVLTNTATEVDFSWTNGWPFSPVPTNEFSARWRGALRPEVQGDHAFYVSAEAGAAIRLIVNGATLIDNWTIPPRTPSSWRRPTGWAPTSPTA